MPVVGIAEVEVRPVFNNLQRSIARQMDGASERAGRSAGSSMGRGMQRGLIPAVAKVTAGVLGIAPAAGAASSALLATGGAVVTLTSSLSSLAGVAALVPAGLMSIAGGAGTIITAFSGMGEALKTAVDASNTVAAANPRIAAMAIEDAMQAISAAEENAAEMQEDAARRVADAKRSLAEAVEDAAEAQVAAAKAVEMAERSEARAARDVIKAQKDLVKAREEAAEKLNAVGASLEAANRRAIETAEAYKKAAALYEAAKADPSSRINELAQLERNAAVALATDKAARSSVVELRDLQAKAQSEAEDANEKVLDAEHRLTDARQSQVDAIQDRKDAQADVLKQEKDGTQRIANAQQSVTDATKDSQKAQIDAARAITDAHRNLERVQLQQADSGSTAGKKAAAAMDKLTPSAREAALALLNVKDQLGGVRRIVQENFFKGFAAPLLALADTVMPQLETGMGAIATAMGDGAKSFMGALDRSLGGGVLDTLLQGIARSTENLNKAISPVAESFTTLGVVGMPYMERLSQFIADMADRFNTFIQTAAADGSLVAWIDAGIQTLKDLWSIAGDVVGIFGSINKAAEAGGLGSTVSGLAAGMAELDEIMKGETFQTTMTTIFGGAAKGLEGMKGALDNIGGAFERGAPLLAEFLRLGGEIAGTFIGGVFDGFSDPTFGAGLKSFMESIQRGAEAVAPLLPGLFAGFGRFLDAIGPIVEKFGPTLVVIFTDLANGLAAVIEFLSPFLAFVAGSPALLIGAVIAIGLLVGAVKILTTSISLIGVQATLTGIKMAAAWVVGLGPIGLIIAGIAALVAGVIWAYNNVGWFKDFVDAAFRAIGDVAKWLFENVLKPTFDGIVWIFQNVLGPAFTRLYENVIKPAFDGIGSAIKWVWENVIKPVFDFLSDAITKTIPKAFEDGVGFIKTFWDGLMDIAKKPIKFVVDTVINKGLIQTLNGVGDLFGLADIPDLKLPDGFASGGYTGDGGKYEPKGVVHGGEFVLTKEQTRKAGVRNLYALAESLDGYAKGGFVNPLKQLIETQGYNRVHKGVDFAASVGTPVFATENGRVSWSGPGVRAPGVWGGNEVHIDGGSGIQSWFAHLSSMAVKVGDMVRAGQQIALSGNTGISSGPHLHFGTFAGGWPNDVNPYDYLSGAGNPSGGGFNPIAAIVDGLIDQFKKAFPAAGFMADLAIGAGKSILDGAVAFVMGQGGNDKRGATAGLPYLHDKGGVLNPGLSSIVNATRKPEAILNAQQWADIHRLATTGGQRGGGDIIFRGNVGWDPNEVAHRIETKRRDTFAAFGI